MLKARRSSEEPAPSHTKLPIEAGIRPLSGIKDLLAEAASARGKRIELAWTTEVPDRVFVLDVQWDANADDPIWSLYEENAGESKKLWAQSFPATDIELFYDVLIMSCGESTPSNKLSDILKPQGQQDKATQPHLKSGDKQQSDAKLQSGPRDDYSLNINPATGSNEVDNQPDASNKPSEATNPVNVPGYPGINSQPAAGIPPGFPPLPYGMLPNAVPSSYPFAYPPPG